MCDLIHSFTLKENKAKLGSSTSNEALPKLFSKTPWKVETSHYLFKGQPRKEVSANSKVLTMALHWLYYWIVSFSCMCFTLAWSLLEEQPVCTNTGPFCFPYADIWASIDQRGLSLTRSCGTHCFAETHLFCGMPFCMLWICIALIGW